MANVSVIVVGAGIVGLAVAHHLRRTGAEVRVVDRDPEGDKASFGNAGGIAVTEVVPASIPGLAWRLPRWLLDPLGPLSIRPRHAPKLIPWLRGFARAGRDLERIAEALASVNRRVHDDLVPMLQQAGLADELIRCGALTVYRSDAALQRDAAEWALKRTHGIEIHPISGADARQMEPALGAAVRQAVFTPQWSQVSDPKRITDGLRAALLRDGVSVTRTIVTRVVPAGEAAALDTRAGQRLQADRIVIAAGAWSGGLARTLGDRVLIESERGYNTTIPDPGVTLGREIIFAEEKFVAAPLRCGLRIGGAAEFGGLDAAPDYRRSAALVTLAKRYLPALTAEGGTPWAGHRPTTPDSLPVIGPSPHHPAVFYAFGHGHLGLTQAATTGRVLADLISGRVPPIDLAPFSIARFH